MDNSGLIIGVLVFCGSIFAGIYLFDQPEEEFGGWQATLTCFTVGVLTLVYTIGINRQEREQWIRELTDSAADQLQGIYVARAKKRGEPARVYSWDMAEIIKRNHIRIDRCDFEKVEDVWSDIWKLHENRLAGGDGKLFKPGTLEAWQFDCN